MDDGQRVDLAEGMCLLSLLYLGRIGWTARPIRVHAVDGTPLGERQTLLHPNHATRQNMHRMRLESVNLEIDAAQSTDAYTCDCVGIVPVIVRRAAGATFVALLGVDMDAARRCVRVRLEFGYLLDVAQT